MVLKVVKVREEDYETIVRELNKRGIEYRSIGDAFTKFIDLSLEGELAEVTPHPSEQSEPEQKLPGGGEQKVTGTGTVTSNRAGNAHEQPKPEHQPPSEGEHEVTGLVTGNRTGNAEELGVVAMGPDILKGLKIDLEREASNIANNSVIRLYYAYARAKRGYRGTLEQFVTEAVRDAVENRGEGKSAFLCFVEA